jgi:uncharacterized protein YegL
VKKKRLTSYLFLSVILHMGLLLGVNTYLRSPSTVIPVELVREQTVILEEERLPPEAKPTIGEQILTKKALETKSQTSTRTTTRPEADDMIRPAPKESRLEPRLTIDQAPLLDVPPVGQEEEREVLETRSRISAGTETRLSVRDLAGPIPREGSFEPSLKVESVPALGVLPSGQQGREVVSKPIVSTFQMPPLRLSPVHPSRSEQPPPLEVEMPEVLVEVETGGVEAYSQTQKKIETPIGRSRVSADSVSELPPIPTVQSPSLPEQREMTLVASHDLPTERLTRSETTRGSRSVELPERSRVSADSVSELPPIPTVESPSLPDQKEMVLAVSHDLSAEKVARSEATRKPQLSTQPDLRLAPRKESTGAPKLLVPTEDLSTLDPYSSLSFPVPGSPKGAAFLFVLDTSGSVKGAPLEGIKRSAWEFVTLMGQNDRAGIMTFNDSTKLLRPFTSKQRLLKQEINNVRTRGRRTVLFDALIQAINVIEKEDRESKVLILFSDGKDEGSRSTVQDVIRELRRSGVSILCVGYSRIEKEYLNTLRKIAAETGGISADAPQFHDIVMLYKAARDTDAPEEQSAQKPQ